MHALRLQSLIYTNSHTPDDVLDYSDIQSINQQDGISAIGAAMLDNGRTDISGLPYVTARSDFSTSSSAAPAVQTNRASVQQRARAPSSLPPPQPPLSISSPPAPVVIEPEVPVYQNGGRKGMGIIFAPFVFDATSQIIVLTHSYSIMVCEGTLVLISMNLTSAYIYVQFWPELVLLEGDFSAQLAYYTLRNPSDPSPSSLPHVETILMLKDIVLCGLLPFSLVGITGLLKGLITSNDLKQIGNEIALEAKDYYEVRYAAYSRLIHGFVHVAGQCQGALFAAKQTNRPRVAKRF
ncbi:hypothetical protein VKT23_015609 [Stygiomarasmius scandens]|uniref:Uncharacterized protein n=1 Tax=Marasmiellus scandens TaxID=2682957 RepID=A0ABR1J206_9AGAR